MYIDEKELPEIRNLKTMHDGQYTSYNWPSELFNKSLSPNIYVGNVPRSFVEKLKNIVSKFFDNVGPIRNLKNYTVDKHHWDSGN